MAELYGLIVEAEISGAARADAARPRKEDVDQMTRREQRPEERQRPTPAAIRAAYGKTLRDVIAPDLDVLFCGINPGLYSAAIGEHFARPGNRFWPALHAAGLTPRVLKPWERTEMLEAGCGVTNFVARATATAAELAPEELRAGRIRLERKVRRFHPRVVAVVGIGAFRVAFDRPHASFGAQPRDFAGARLWVLPNTSGLNAHHQPRDLARAFGALRAAVAKIPTLSPRRLPFPPDGA